jgi:hypothetical protein
MRASWRVMWAEPALVLLAVGPIVTFPAVVIVEAAIAALAPTAAVAMLVPAIGFVVCASMFWSAAIVAGANDVAEGRHATVAASLERAAAHLPAVCAWAFYSLTVGVAIRLVSSVFGRFGAFVAYAGETAWSVATMLVLPAIVIDGASSRDARRLSCDVLHTTWGERLTGQLGFDLVAAVLCVPVVGFVVLAALLDNSALMSVALLTCVAVFIGVALMTSACVSVYRTMLYREVHGRPVPEPYDASIRVASPV